MKRLISILVSGAFAVSAVFAQGTALPFIRMDRNPVTAGLAGAGSAMVTPWTAYSSFSNPAVAAFSATKFDIGLNYGMWAPKSSDLTIFGGGVGFKPIEGLVISAGAVMQNWPEMELYSPTGTPDGTFTPREMLFSLGAGYAILPNVSVGANVHYASEQLGEGSNNSVSAICGDVFAAYSTGPLQVSAGIAALGGKVDGKYDLPTSAKLAGAYMIPFEKVHSITLVADADYYFSGDAGVSAGLQYAYDGLAFLRAGYRYATDGAPVPTHLAVGGGISYQGLRVDISYITLSEIIGGSLSLGLAYSF
ncbi:MAG: PorV/PorQ family protein [Bacteroidales bacterium]|nr:PorV/PorQ family protein [Bacteroidales bacterium]